MLRRPGFIQIFYDGGGDGGGGGSGDDDGGFSDAGYSGDYGSMDAAADSNDAAAAASAGDAQGGGGLSSNGDGTWSDSFGNTYSGVGPGDGWGGYSGGYGNEVGGWSPAGFGTAFGGGLSTNDNVFNSLSDMAYSAIDDTDWGPSYGSPSYNSPSYSSELDWGNNAFDQLAEMTAGAINMTDWDTGPYGTQALNTDFQSPSFSAPNEIENQFGNLAEINESQFDMRNDIGVLPEQTYGQLAEINESQFDMSDMMDSPVAEISSNIQNTASPEFNLANDIEDYISAQNDYNIVTSSDRMGPNEESTPAQSNWASSAFSPGGFFSNEPMGPSDAFAPGAPGLDFNDIRGDQAWATAAQSVGFNRDAQPDFQQMERESRQDVTDTRGLSWGDFNPISSAQAAQEDFYEVPNPFPAPPLTITRNSRPEGDAFRSGSSTFNDGSVVDTGVEGPANTGGPVSSGSNSSGSTSSGIGLGDFLGGPSMSSPSSPNPLAGAGDGGVGSGPGLGNAPSASQVPFQVAQIEQTLKQILGNTSGNVLPPMQSLQGREQMGSQSSPMSTLVSPPTPVQPPTAPPQQPVVNMRARYADMTAPQSEVNAMAHAMIGEARNQGRDGMLAVGHNINNRANTNYGPRGGYGNTVAAQAQAPYQYSYLNPNDRNNRAAADRAQQTNSPLWQQAQELARDILEGRVADPTRGATLYHNPRESVANRAHMEAEQRGAVDIGDHRFSDFRNAPNPAVPGYFRGEKQDIPMPPARPSDFGPQVAPGMMGAPMMALPAASLLQQISDWLQELQGDRYGDFRPEAKADRAERAAAERAAAAEKFGNRVEPGRAGLAPSDIIAAPTGPSPLADIPMSPTFSPGFRAGDPARASEPAPEMHTLTQDLPYFVGAMDPVNFVPTTGFAPNPNINPNDPYDPYVIGIPPSGRAPDAPATSPDPGASRGPVAGAPREGPSFIDPSPAREWGMPRAGSPVAEPVPMSAPPLEPPSQVRDAPRVAEAPARDRSLDEIQVGPRTDRSKGEWSLSDYITPGRVIDAVIGAPLGWQYAIPNAILRGTTGKGVGDRLFDSVNPNNPFFINDPELREGRDPWAPPGDGVTPRPDKDLASLTPPAPAEGGPGTNKPGPVAPTSPYVYFGRAYNPYRGDARRYGFGSEHPFYEYKKRST